MDTSSSNPIDAAEFQRITNVSRETFCLYEAWYNLLTHWNKTINLVSPNTVYNYWLRHALDSWQVFEDQEARSEAIGDHQGALTRLAPARDGEIPHQVRDDRIGDENFDVPSAARQGQVAAGANAPHPRRRQLADCRERNKPQPFNILDLGSGAGFPGLAAAIHYRNIPNAHVYLVEANGKKCNFLRAVIRELGLPATAIQARAENVPEILKDKHFNIISARAFAPLPKLLQYSAPYWSVDKQEARREQSDRPGMHKEARSVSDRECVNEARRETLGIFPKGRNWQGEVTAARKHWHFDLKATKSKTDEDAMILLVTNLVKRGGE